MTLLSLLFFSNTATALDLDGTWHFDVDASIERCIRLNLSDCTDKTKAENTRAEMNKMLEKGEMYFVFNKGSMESFAFGKSKTGQYDVFGDAYAYTIIKDIDETGKYGNPMAFILEKTNVICLGEGTKSADALCLRKK